MNQPAGIPLAQVKYLQQAFSAGQAELAAIPFPVEYIVINQHESLRPARRVKIYGNKIDIILLT
jgi:hypothetical protein